MTIYISGAEPEKRAQIFKLTRRWITVVASLILLVDVGLGNHYRLWMTNRGVFSRLLEIGLIGPIVVLVQVWSPWGSRFKTISEAAGQRSSLTIANDEIVLESPVGVRRFSTREIVRAEEPKLGSGLYLRTANRYRWLLIQKRLDGYDEAKTEIRSLGIPAVRTVILPNWEEFVGVALFCTSLLCDMFSASRPLLLANLVAAILLGIGGWYVVSANPDDRKTRNLARIGAGLPAIFAAVALYFAS